MDKEEILTKLNQFNKLVINKYNPLKIILFGSYAKNTFHAESDIDIAIIVDKINDDFLEQESELFKMRRNIDANIEPVLFENGNDRSGLLDEINKHGEILYQRQ